MRINSGTADCVRAVSNSPPPQTNNIHTYIYIYIYICRVTQQCMQVEGQRAVGFGCNMQMEEVCGLRHIVEITMRRGGHRYEGGPSALRTETSL